MLTVWFLNILPSFRAKGKDICGARCSLRAWPSCEKAKRYQGRYLQCAGRDELEGISRSREVANNDEGCRASSEVVDGVEGRLHDAIVIVDEIM